MADGSAWSPTSTRRSSDDIQAVRTHPLIPRTVAVGGFMYDVDTGLLEPIV